MQLKSLHDSNASSSNESATAEVRIMFLADSHLGFDMPARPRVKRRRRGLDFFANFERVLDAAVAEQVDCVVHGGDLFYRSRIPASLVQEAFLPVKRVADAGIPFFVVPGNHERSRIPYEMLALHPGVHIFDRPRTFVVNVRGVSVALAGFPYFCHDVRSEFPALLDETGWSGLRADVNLLCVHHCFEGATVGSHNYVFRNGRDVIKHGDVPGTFAAVLTGHVHRSQVLRQDLRGRALQTPVFYPGSIERTSFAEKDEEKGYIALSVVDRGLNGGAVSGFEFRRLPSRPMVVAELEAGSRDRDELTIEIRRILSQLPVDAIVQLRVLGSVRQDARSVLRAECLRSLAPPTMNLELRKPSFFVKPLARRSRIGS